MFKIFVFLFLFFLNNAFAKTDLLSNVYEKVNIYTKNSSNVLINLENNTYKEEWSAKDSVICVNNKSINTVGLVSSFQYNEKDYSVFISYAVSDGYLSSKVSDGSISVIGISYGLRFKTFENIYFSVSHEKVILVESFDLLMERNANFVAGFEYVAKF